MIKAKDVMAPSLRVAGKEPDKRVGAETGILDVLPRLLDSSEGIIGVEDDGALKGVIDSESLLSGFGQLLAARDDSSQVAVECYPEDYSASRLAHAVEDTDTHLVDLISTPGSDGRIYITLRVRRQDPTPVVNSLERYGYKVVDTSSSGRGDAEVAFDRLLALNRLLNV